jgi:hypothetical protein
MTKSLYRRLCTMLCFICASLFCAFIGLWWSGATVASVKLDLKSIFFRDEVLLIQKLPQDHRLINAAGDHLDLAYHFRLEGGEWMLLTKYRDSYPLTANLQREVFKVGHMSKLPPVPEIPWTCFINRVTTMSACLLLAFCSFIFLYVRPNRFDRMPNGSRFQYNDSWDVDSIDHDTKPLGW